MGIKRHTPEQIVSKLRQVEVLVGQGMARIDTIRQISIAEQTYYRWRKHYGGMGKGQLKELKRLQKENERLRRAVSDLIKAGTPRRMNRSVSTSMTSVELSLRFTRIARHSRLNSSRMFSVRNTFPSSVL